MRRHPHPHHYIWYFSRTYDDRIQIQIRVPTNACHFIMPSMHCHCHHDYCCWNHFLKREVQDFVLNSGPHPPTHPYGLGLPKVKTIFMNKLYNTIWNTGTDCDHKNKIWNENQVWKRATDCDQSCWWLTSSRNLFSQFLRIPTMTSFVWSTNKRTICMIVLLLAFHKMVGNPPWSNTSPFCPQKMQEI